MYFNVNFNVFFRLIKVQFLVSELNIYIYQNARCNDKKKNTMHFRTQVFRVALDFIFSDSDSARHFKKRFDLKQQK